MDEGTTGALQGWEFAPVYGVPNLDDDDANDQVDWNQLWWEGDDDMGSLLIHADAVASMGEGETVRLTTREAGLLRALIEREGQAVTRGELLESVWGLRPDTRTRVIDSFIHRLRRLLEEDPSRPRHIVSVRGHGYRFVR